MEYVIPKHVLWVKKNILEKAWGKYLLILTSSVLSGLVVNMLKDSGTVSSSYSTGQHILPTPTSLTARKITMILDC